MRTTLDIDEDLLAAAKELAIRQKTTAGQVVSRLLREALTGSATESSAPLPDSGFRAFPARGVVVTDALIEQLREAEGI